MLRRRSIRLRIIVLVLVPVAALLGLYAELLNLTMGNLLTLKQEASIRQLVTLPVVNVQSQLGEERTLALQYLARSGHGDLGVLRAQQRETNAAIKKFRNAVLIALRSGPVPKERQAFLSWRSDLGRISELRTSVRSLGLTQIAAADAYSTMLNKGDNVLNQAIIPVLTGPIGVQATDVMTMAKAAQNMAEESDLLRADLLARSFPPEDLMLIDQLAVLHQEEWSLTLPNLDPVLQNYFRTMIPQEAASQLTGMESDVASGPSGAAKVPLPAWTAAEDAYQRGFLKALLKSAATLAKEASNQARGLVLKLALIAGLGLLAIVIAAAIGIAIGRGLIRQLRDLRQSAVRLSTEQLPGTIGRLRAGEDVDVGAEVPPLEPGSDEIGQVKQAVNMAARTAISAAADEVKIRRGVNDVFRSLARRNQSLLTRQLQLLDSMERRVHDPEELADLFRVDHMTTRMRRHAEGLLIVAGGSSGRTWREPVPIVDVMRAAAAEVEDYTRIRVTSRTGAALAGHAVADVIHLLAELVENATTFSPASTPVRVDGEKVARGVVVEIEDRGLGMSDDQLAAINATLADPPLFDLSGSDQLGLFIAGQLGRRHDVKVTVRSSAYGGITAVVLIPRDLIVDTGEPEEPLPLAGIRELGGRPLPELPSAAADPGRTIADAVSGAGYLLGLEAQPAWLSADPVTDQGAPPDRAKESDAWQISAYLGDDPTAPDLPRRQPGTTGLSWNENASPGWDAGPARWPEIGAAADVQPTTASSDLAGQAISGPDLADASRAAAGPAAAGPADAGLAGTDVPGAGPAGQEPAGARPNGPHPSGAETNGTVPARTAPAHTAPAHTAPAHTVPAHTAPADVTGAELLELDGLPVRVRQASLAPQLRDQAATVPGGAAEPAAGPAAGPSPEAARSTMAALQLGWQRGRSATESAGDEFSSGPSQDSGDSPDEGGSS